MSLGEARQLGRASCLTLAGRVTLAGGTTFSHIKNTLARLTLIQQNAQNAQFKQTEATVTESLNEKIC